MMDPYEMQTPEKKRVLVQFLENYHEKNPIHRFLGNYTPFRMLSCNGVPIESEFVDAADFCEPRDIDFVAMGYLDRLATYPARWFQKPGWLRVNGDLRDEETRLRLAHMLSETSRGIDREHNVMYINNGPYGATLEDFKRYRPFASRFLYLLSGSHMPYTRNDYFALQDFGKISIDWHHRFANYRSEVDWRERNLWLYAISALDNDDTELAAIANVAEASDLKVRLLDKSSSTPDGRDERMASAHVPESLIENALTRRG
jgi:hypothetical protein